MEGGFVTANCFNCNKKETLTESEFKKLPLIVCCPECQEIMSSETIEKNYSFFCKNCNIYIFFSDLLPKWEDREFLNFQEA